jgi:N-acetylmuramoyl-L-alanine amidase
LNDAPHDDRLVDAQRRLTQLGYRSSDPEGEFGNRTRAAIEAFQRSKGLRLTGELDDATWRRLEEASWEFGQRLLYASEPLLRGDDVAELQMRLSQLGFDSGHIDGIFGPTTESALREFQRNCGVATSGVLDRATLDEVLRLAPFDVTRRLVTEARDMAGLSYHYGPIILTGSHELVSGLAREFTRHGETVIVDRDIDVAAHANELGASYVIACDPIDDPVMRIHYWVGYRSHSRRGEQLASAMAAAIAQHPDAPRVDVTGMAHPLLRETRMPALEIEIGHLTLAQVELVSDALATTFAEFFHK